MTSVRAGRLEAGPRVGAGSNDPLAAAGAGRVPQGSHPMRLHVRALVAAVAIVACASGGVLSETGTAVLAQELAPVQVSLVSEAGEAAAAAHRSVVAADQLSDREHPVGEWHSFVLTHAGRRAVEASPRLGEAEAEEQAVTFGLGRRAGDDFWWGAALSVGRHDTGVSGASLEGDTAVGALHGTWRQGGLYLSGALNLGQAGLEIERSTTLGPAGNTEQGSTTARQMGLDIGLSWVMGEADGARHGPVLGLSWLDQELDGYHEGGRATTSLTFSRFARESLVVRGGYRFAFEAGSGRLGIRPYAAVAYETELRGDPVAGSAGSDTTAERVAVEGFMPSENWLSIDLGVSMNLGGQASAVLGYSGRSGDRSRSDHLVNVGLRVAF